MRLTALLFLLFTGCGYQFGGGRLPGDVRLLYFPLAINTTAEPFIENQLAGPVTAVLARQREIQLVESLVQAEALLQATVTRYGVKPLSYDSNDRISEFLATLQVHFRLTRQSNGRLLWQGDLLRQESYRAAVDKNQQEDLELGALDRMVKNIADDLAYQLVTRF